VPFVMSTASSRSIEAVGKANGDGHRWFQLYWYASNPFLPPPPRPRTLTRANRPRHDEVTLSVLRRARAAGFTTLVVTLDTFLLGWRPHDLDTAYLPFVAGVGVQVGTSDPVFMQRQQVPLRPDERPAFPLDLEAFRARLAAGDEQAREAFALGAGWLQEANSGMFRSWEDLAFLRANWDGPIVLKGIQTVEDAHAAMDAHMDGIVVSNHGTCSR
jgi:lactate 2-monooxygenase